MWRLALPDQVPFSPGCICRGLWRRFLAPVLSPQPDLLGPSGAHATAPSVDDPERGGLSMNRVACAVTAAALITGLSMPAHAEDPFGYAAENETGVSAQAFARLRWGAEDARDPQRFTYGLNVSVEQSCGASLVLDQNRACFAGSARGVELRDFASGAPSLWFVGDGAQAVRFETAAHFQDDVESDGDTNWTLWAIGGAVLLGGGYLVYSEIDDDIDDGIGDMMDDIFS